MTDIKEMVNSPTAIDVKAIDAAEFVEHIAPQIMQSRDAAAKASLMIVTGRMIAEHNGAPMYLFSILAAGAHSPEIEVCGEAIGQIAKTIRLPEMDGAAGEMLIRLALFKPPQQSGAVMSFGPGPYRRYVQDGNTP